MKRVVPEVKIAHEEPTTAGPVLFRPVLAEDFSLLVRSTRRRVRAVRSRVGVMH